MRRWLGVAAGVLAATVLAGCPTHQTSGPTPVQVALWHGQPPALSAKLLLKATDANGESLQTTLYLWHAADGRTRLLLTKVDVDVLQALIQPDGSFVAFAPRSQFKTSGELADPKLPTGLADLRLLLSEVCDGPVPPSARLTAGDSGVFSGSAGSYQATLSFDPATFEVRDKLLSDAAGHPRYHLAYTRYQAFDELHRPTRVEVAPPEGGSLVAHLLRCESLGDISAERMRLAIPETARAVTPTDFLEHLDQ